MTSRSHHFTVVDTMTIVADASFSIAHAAWRCLTLTSAISRPFVAAAQSAVTSGATAYNTTLAIAWRGGAERGLCHGRVWCML